eukprot:g9932.t1
MLGRPTNTSKHVQEHQARAGRFDCRAPYLANGAKGSAHTAGDIVQTVEKRDEKTESHGSGTSPPGVCQRKTKALLAALQSNSKAYRRRVDRCRAAFEALIRFGLEVCDSRSAVASSADASCFASWFFEGGAGLRYADAWAACERDGATKGDTVQTVENRDEKTERHGPGAANARTASVLSSAEAGAQVEESQKIKRDPDPSTLSVSGQVGPHIFTLLRSCHLEGGAAFYVAPEVYATKVEKISREGVGDVAASRESDGPRRTSGAHWAS